MITTSAKSITRPMQGISSKAALPMARRHSPTISLRRFSLYAIERLGSIAASTPDNANNWQLDSASHIDRKGFRESTYWTP